MKEKIKLYVSKNEDISEDLLFADDTTLTSYFNETECEVITENCELCLLEKILNQRVIDCLKEVKEELNYGDYDFGTIAVREVENIIDTNIKELIGEEV